jgi:recombination protein U
MAIRYPNGQSPLNSDRKLKNTQALRKKKTIEFGKRGMNFEEEINQSNQYYLTHEKAVIYKKPTPVQIVKVDYPKRSMARITEGYFRQASTTDYNGVYKGMYLDFEAKETKQKTSFPFSNFHEHQITHMENVLHQDGIAFVLLYFSQLNRCFFYPASELISAWQEKETTRKSLPLVEIEENGIEISFGIAPRIPYLEAVENYIEKRR